MDREKMFNIIRGTVLASELKMEDKFKIVEEISLIECELTIIEEEKGE